MKRIIAIILGVALLAAALAGCGLNLSIGGLSFLDGKSFDVNDHGQQGLSGVTAIEISTVSGTVTLTAGGSDVTADLAGTCRSSIKPVWLDMRTEGGTIRIEVKYPDCTTNDDTRLTVQIPAEFSGNLSVKTVSGGIEAASEPWSLRNVTLASVSGNVNFGTASAAFLKAGSTSGEVTLSGAACPTTVDTVSGGIDVDYNALSDLTANTVSGNVSVRVPKESAFRVEFGSISGSFSSSGTLLEVSNASHGFSGSAGAGGALLNVHTTSGDFRLDGK